VNRHAPSALDFLVVVGPINSAYSLPLIDLFSALVFYLANDSFLLLNRYQQCTNSAVEKNLVRSGGRDSPRDLVRAAIDLPHCASWSFFLSFLGLIICPWRNSPWIRIESSQYGNSRWSILWETRATNLKSGWNRRNKQEEERRKETVSNLLACCSAIWLVEEHIGIRVCSRGEEGRAILCLCCLDRDFFSCGKRGRRWKLSLLLCANFEAEAETLEEATSGCSYYRALLGSVWPWSVCCCFLFRSRLHPHRRLLFGKNRRRQSVGLGFRACRRSSDPKLENSVCFFLDSFFPRRPGRVSEIAKSSRVFFLFLLWGVCLAPACVPVYLWVTLGAHLKLQSWKVIRRGHSAIYGALERIQYDVWIKYVLFSLFPSLPLHLILSHGMYFSIRHVSFLGAHKLFPHGIFLLEIHDRCMSWCHRPDEHHVLMAGLCGVRVAVASATSSTPTVIVIGAGFGGLAAARFLHNSRFKVLAKRKPSYTWQTFLLKP
jgi:hypothetical protein